MKACLGKLLLLAKVNLQSVLNAKENEKNSHSLVILHRILDESLPEYVKTATI